MQNRSKALCCSLAASSRFTALMMRLVSLASFVALGRMSWRISRKGLLLDFEVMMFIDSAGGKSCQRQWALPRKNGVRKCARKESRGKNG